MEFVLFGINYRFINLFTLCKFTVLFSMKLHYSIAFQDVRMHFNYSSLIHTFQILPLITL